jgi:hypothetical protein
MDHFDSSYTCAKELASYDNEFQLPHHAKGDSSSYERLVFDPHTDKTSTDPWRLNLPPTLSAKILSPFQMT